VSAPPTNAAASAAEHEPREPENAGTFCNMYPHACESFDTMG